MMDVISFILGICAGVGGFIVVDLIDDFKADRRARAYYEQPVTLYDDDDCGPSGGTADVGRAYSPAPPVVEAPPGAPDMFFRGG